MLYCENSGTLEFKSPEGGAFAVMGSAMPHGEPGESSRAEFRPKYAQIRPDQWSRLDELARELQDAKTRRGGERITANTLIRIGIDVVLAYASQLGGDNEQEIREGLLAILRGDQQ